MHEVFGPNELKAFFKAMDDELSKPTELLLIGGAAAALAYKVTRATQDIDTLTRMSNLEKAYKNAISKTGYEIPMETVGVHDGPYNYEERLVALSNLKLKKLNVLVPEIHDLILMKTTRGYEHDFEGIEEMIRKNKVSKAVLEERIQQEMSHIIGDQKRLDLNYQKLLELV